MKILRGIAFLSSDKVKIILSCIFFIRKFSSISEERIWLSIWRYLPKCTHVRMVALPSMLATPFLLLACLSQSVRSTFAEEHIFPFDTHVHCTILGFGFSKARFLISLSSLQIASHRFKLDSDLPSV